MSVALIRTIALQGQVRGSLAELLGHYFSTLLAECPACGSSDCEAWLLVRELAPPSQRDVLAVETSGAARL